MAVLYLIATPIGNLEDMSLRALRVLGQVPAVACEDTRVTRKIFERHHITPPAIRFSCHEHNEESAARRVLGLLNDGMDVALCTDGGMPCVSDPGYRVVTLCQEQGHRVEVIPGPSALITALVLSGLPSSSFTFKGFPPRKAGPRARFLRMELDQPHTLVFFESPYRLAHLLRDAWSVLGDRQAAVCVELTKLHERVHRGYLSELTARFENHTLKGEVTVVIAGNHPKFMCGANRDAPEREHDEAGS